MSDENRSERRKWMELLRWSALFSDLVAAAVFVLFADSVGDMAYTIATILVIVGFVYFALWHRIFKSSYATE